MGSNPAFLHAAGPLSTVPSTHRSDQWAASGGTGLDLKPSGKTTDGKLVVSGVFRWTDTEGIPLTIMLTLLDERGWVVNWPDFITEAERHGWKTKTIISRCREGLADVYGDDYFKEWKKSYDRWTGLRGGSSI